MILTTNSHFLDMARDELRQVAPRARWQVEFAPGVWLVSLQGDFFDLAERWRQRPPIFIRHICPLQTQISLPQPADPATAVAALQQPLADLLDLVDPNLPFSVQTRVFDTVVKPFPVNDALATTIEQQTGAPRDVRQPQQILSVVVHQQTAYLGLSLALHNLSDWAGGMRRFARDEGQISRAEFKLLEALEVFQIELPPYGVALDLGAAPGGWTRVLYQQEQYVTAVDPAALHPSLQKISTIRHKRLTAEAYLAEGPDTFDIIVNDMRQDARDSARLMVDFAPYLYRHGTGLITFKLPGEGQGPIIDYAFSILRDAYRLAGARQLFHNRSEITVFLQPLNAR